MIKVWTRKERRGSGLEVGWEVETALCERFLLDFRDNWLTLEKTVIIN